MALMTFKPTSPGRRSAVRVVTPDLHKGAPHAALVESQSKSGGRNHHGRITTRHIGGGHKQHYRIIDFKRDKEGIPARARASARHMCVLPKATRSTCRPRLKVKHPWH